MKSKGEQQLETLVEGISEIQTELSRLRGIETAAKTLLDDLHENAAGGIKCSAQAEALALASGWTPSLRKADPAPPASPTGTLITNFADLRAGDKVRIEGKRCGTQVGILAAFYSLALMGQPFPYWGYWGMMVSEGSERDNCLDEPEFPKLRVWLLSRKPYVKDGRWVALPGDKFKKLGPFAGVHTVVSKNDVTANYTCTDPDGNNYWWCLDEHYWTPVEDA